MLTLGADLTPSQRPGEFLAACGALSEALATWAGPVVVGGVADPVWSDAGPRSL